MKKVLLLGALLSTIAFGAINGAEESKATANVTLTGKAIEALQISAAMNTIAFGTVVIGQDIPVKSTDINITTGTKGQKVRFNVAVGENGNGVKAYFGSEGTTTKDITIQGTDADKATVSFKYTPTTAGSLNTTVTITATYVE